MADHVNAPAEVESGPPKDPIEQGSLLWPIFLATLALLLSTAWALYDEGFTRRQYKRFQKSWVDVAAEAYRGKLAAAQHEYDTVVSSEPYQELDRAVKAAEAEAAPRIRELQDELDHAIMPWLAVLAWPVKIAKSEVAAFTYRYEHAKAEGHDAEAQRWFSQLTAVKEESHSIRFPGEDAPRELKYVEMADMFQDLKARQGRIQGLMADANKKVDVSRAALSKFRDANLRGASPEAIGKLVSSLDEFIHEIKQIHAQGPDGELIERCESCHLGIRSPVELTLADVGGRKEFISHPKMDLLGAHDPERFGCSPCHNGLGIAVATPERAHGYFKHSVTPMFRKENIEAGCVKCHQDDLHLENAPTFNEGKQVFYTRGCWGCHPYEGFMVEAVEQKTLRNAQDTTQKRVEATQMLVAEQIAIQNDTNATPEMVEAAASTRAKKEQELHLAETELVGIRSRIEQLDLEVKKVGPNLKEVAAKLRPEWLHSWLMDPRAFRPDTKMPRFRLDDEQAWDIAAFLWQESAPTTNLVAAGEGDAEKGQRAVITRGCLGCHVVSTDEFETIGAGWAANLSRLGEKATPEYIASWVRNPRHHNKYTVMPSLRLSDEEARDIAAWLGSKKKDDATYPAADDALAILKDEARKARGRKLVQHLGCAGCHEIKGLENEGRIGTELTEEGSKPLERLDFGTQTKKFKHLQDPRHEDRHSQYDHKGFIEHKLQNPAIWDEGRLIANWTDRLKMPSFWIRPGEAGYEEAKAEIGRDIDALTTFLLGSVERLPPPLGPPERLYYEPTDYRKDLQDGWWIIKKYNCDGCHQIQPGEMPALWKLPIYQDGAGFEGVPDKNGRPPTLVGEGSRVDPAWLSNFLANPSLTTDSAESLRNGVRQAMLVRMPTFDLSERERMKLVRFFIAMARLSEDYVRPVMPTLRGEELELARAAFTAGDCANCHLLGGEVNPNPTNIYAPSFQPVAERIRPAWIHKWVTEPNRVIPGTAMPAILQQMTDGDTVRWIINGEKISETAKKRVGPAMLKRLADYPGDHADLLQRYFAQWNETEANHQKEARKIN